MQGGPLTKWHALSLLQAENACQRLRGQVEDLHQQLAGSSKGGRGGRQGQAAAGDAAAAAAAVVLGGSIRGCVDVGRDDESSWIAQVEQLERMVDARDARSMQLETELEKVGIWGCGGGYCSLKRS